MKKIILALFTLLCLNSYSQINRIGLEEHKIDLHLPKIVSNNPDVISLSPINKIKITFRAGINFSNSLDLSDFYQKIGYEYIIKYYVNNKVRVLFRDYVPTMGTDNYSIGVQYKF